MSSARKNVLAAVGIVVGFLIAVLTYSAMQKSAIRDAFRQAVVRKAVAEGRLSRQEAREIIGYDVPSITCEP